MDRRFNKILTSRFDQTLADRQCGGQTTLTLVSKGLSFSQSGSAMPAGSTKPTGYTKLAHCARKLTSSLRNAMISTSRSRTSARDSSARTRRLYGKLKDPQHDKSTTSQPGAIAGHSATPSACRAGTGRHFRCRRRQ